MLYKFVCLQIHNDYQIQGGETKTAIRIADVLEEYGIKVIRYYKTNDSFKDVGLLTKVKYGIKSIYNKDTFSDIEEILSKEHIDFALVHNVVPVVSNSIYDVLQKNGVPIIKYLQNYNLLCLNGALDKGLECDRCRKNNLVGVCKKCYKDSFFYSLVKYVIKRELDSKYLDIIGLFMANSQFVANRHISGGIDKNKMQVMWNYISDNCMEPSEDRNTYLYFGRISREKGVLTTIKAFECINDLRLKIVGSGELEDEIRHYIDDNSLTNVSYVGPLFGDDLRKEISNAKYVIVPSEWDEPLPRTVMEAYAQGTPVIGANRGGIPEMIEVGKTGYIFEAGNVDALRQVAEYAEKQPAQEYREMRERCRRTVEEVYSKEKYVDRFMEGVKKLLS